MNEQLHATYLEGKNDGVATGLEHALLRIAQVIDQDAAKRPDAVAALRNQLIQDLANVKGVPPSGVKVRSVLLDTELDTEPDKMYRESGD